MSEVLTNVCNPNLGFIKAQNLIRYPGHSTPEQLCIMYINLFIFNQNPLQQLTINKQAFAFGT